MDEYVYLLVGFEDGYFEFEGVKSLGLICYDICFLEWIRKYMIKGVNVLFIFVEWFLFCFDYWKSLFIVWVIEN